nr:hypothetical protein BaRGS_002424 [Batillaria attramentaria]
MGRVGVYGHVVDKASGDRITDVVVEVEQVGVSVPVNGQGQFSFYLPTNHYTMRVRGEDVKDSTWPVTVLHGTHASQVVLEVERKSTILGMSPMLLITIAGTLGLLVLIFITAVICIKSQSKVQYNQLGFRPVRNDDDEDEDEEDYLYGGSRYSDWAPKSGARAAQVFRDSPSEDEEDDKLFEKRLLRK